MFSFYLQRGSQPRSFIMGEATGVGIIPITVVAAGIILTIRPTQVIAPGLC